MQAVVDLRGGGPPRAARPRVRRHPGVAEGEEVIETEGDSAAKDAALIAAAQRVEHYEIAAYGTARQLANDLDLSGIRDLMDQTLDEESQADKLLTKIATGGMFKAGVNQQAV